MNAPKIATTIRLEPRILAILAKGIRTLCPQYGRFRSPASVVVTACNLLSDVMEQKCPELSKMTDSDVAEVLVNLNSLDNKGVHDAIAESLIGVMSELVNSGSDLPECSKFPEPSERFRIQSEIPKNFLIDDV